MELFDRTLHDLIYKNKEDKLLSGGPKNTNEIYINSIHTRMQMTPKEACEEVNNIKLKEFQIKKNLKFNGQHKNKEEGDIFKTGDAVLL